MTFRVWSVRVDRVCHHDDAIGGRDLVLVPPRRMFHKERALASAMTAP